MKTCRKGLHQYELKGKGCPECDKIRKTVWAETNPEKVRISKETWAKDNQEKKKASEKYWYKINHQKAINRSLIRYRSNTNEVKAKSADWARNNPDKRRVIRIKWSKNNPDKVNSLTVKRRTAKLQRTPPWTIKDHYREIECFYFKSSTLTKETGIQYQVDHIIPLQGENVSGLHVPWNLQILTKSENARKNNSFDFTYDNNNWR